MAEEVVCPSCGSSFQIASTRIPPSTTLCAWEKHHFARFELREILGTGAFGTVWKCHDPRLDRTVALKIPRPGLLNVRLERDRFFREARAAAQLHHDCIVAIHEVGEHDGQPYIVSDYVEGVDLAQWLTAKSPNFREAAIWIAGVADALQSAHDRGVIHRDIKPSNLMLDGSGRLHVMDFGLAKRDAGEVTMTQDGQILGTPAYMAPEQIEKAHHVDGRADVYALGVLMYRLLTGELPFRGTTRMLLHQVLHDEPIPPRSLNDRVPRDLETICLKAMAKEPARRFTSAAELSQELQRYLRGETIIARPVGKLEKGWRWCQRNPTVAILTTLFSLSLATGAIVSTLFGIRASKKATDAFLASQAAAQAQKEEAAQRTAAENLAYANGLALAHREWEANDINRALQLLDSGPSRLRGWEWTYVRGLCSLDRLTLPAISNRHASTIDISRTSVACSPDGRWIASGGGHNSVQVWDAETGHEVLILLGHGAGVNCVTFSPDGTKLASTSDDRTLKLWSVPMGTNIWSVHLPSMHTGPVVFRPDGKALATLGVWYDLNLWDVASGRRLKSLEPPAAPKEVGRGQSTLDNFALAFSPDGRRVATGKLDSDPYFHDIRILDGESGKEMMKLQGHRGGIADVAFSPDGARIASASADHTIRLWDATNGREVFTFRGHVAAVNSVAFSKDGRRLASGSSDRTVRVWDPATGLELLSIRGPREEVYGVAFHHDGREVVTVSGLRHSAKVQLWPALNPQEAMVFRAQNTEFDTVEFTSDDSGIVAGENFGTSRFWQIGSGALTTITQDTDEYSDQGRIALSPDGALLATVVAKDAAETTNDAPISGSQYAIILSSSGGGGKIRELRGHEIDIEALVFSPDSRRLLSVAGSDEVRNERGEAKLWDLHRGEEAFEVPKFRERLSCAAFSPDGSRFAVAGGFSSEIFILDAKGGRIVETLSGQHELAVFGLAYSPDGRYLASAGQDAKVVIWDTSRRQLPVIFKGHSRVVHSLAFSPDGRRLATASWDNTIKLWEIGLAQEVFTLRGHTDHVNDVTFSRDGRMIASASRDGTVRVWQAREAKPRSCDAAPERSARELLDDLIHSGTAPEDLVEEIRKQVKDNPELLEAALRLASCVRGR